MLPKTRRRFSESAAGPQRSPFNRSTSAPGSLPSQGKDVLAPALQKAAADPRPTKAAAMGRRASAETSMAAIGEVSCVTALATAKTAGEFLQSVRDDYDRTRGTGRWLSPEMHSALGDAAVAAHKRISTARESHGSAGSAVAATQVTKAGNTAQQDGGPGHRLKASDPDAFVSAQAFAKQLAPFSVQVFELRGNQMDMEAFDDERFGRGMRTWTLPISDRSLGPIDIKTGAQLSEHPAGRFFLQTEQRPMSKAAASRKKQMGEGLSSHCALTKFAHADEPGLEDHIANYGVGDTALLPYNLHLMTDDELKTVQGDLRALAEKMSDSDLAPIGCSFTLVETDGQLQTGADEKPCVRIFDSDKTASEAVHVKAALDRLPQGAKYLQFSEKVEKSGGKKIPLPIVVKAADEEAYAADLSASEQGPAPRNIFSIGEVHALPAMARAANTRTFREIIGLIDEVLESRS